MARSEKAVIFAILLILGCAIYTLFAAGLVGDKNVLMFEARMLLSGRKMYVDMLEINPPLIVWLYTIPVFFSLHLGFAKDYQMLILLGTALAAFSIYLSARVLDFHPEFKGNARLGIWHMLLLGLLLIATPNPAFAFDREHFFLMLVLPYIFRFMPSVTQASLSRKLRFAIGCMAGVGFCIKPHCAILFIGVQLLRFLRKPGVAMLFVFENLIIYVIAALYIASVLLLNTEYVTVILPMVFATYFGDSERINSVLYTVVTLVILGVAFADFKWRATSPYRRDIYYLLALTPALLFYALANNGWGYTYNPLISLALIITGWAAMEYAWFKRDAEKRGENSRQFLFGLRGCIASLGLIILGCTAFNFLTVNLNCTEHLKCTRMGRELIETVGDAHSFGALSGNSGTWVSLSNTTGAEFDTLTAFWMLPKFFIAGEDFKREHHQITDYIAEALAAEIDRKKPEIIFVDNMDVLYMTPIYIDLVAYFSAFPHFRESWSHYLHTQTINTCSHPEKKHCSFEVYRRQP